MRLLVFNLATDADDPILGFTTAWLRALARQVECVSVITMRAGRLELPDNVHVHSVGKEKGYSEPRRAVEFYRHLFALTRANRFDGCFSHMIPVFSILAAPVLRRRGVPLVTWHAHPHVTGTLKLAHRLSDRMVSSTASAYGYRHDKLLPLGQGIDTDAFAPGSPVPDEAPPLLVSVGRLSPIKGLETLIDAVRRLRARGRLVRCAIVGSAPPRDEAYADRLNASASDLRGAVEFVGPVTHPQTISWYRRGFAHINCSPPDHSPDKAVLEAMACGRPSLSSTLACREIMGPWAERLAFRQDPGHLAEQLERLIDAPASERARMGAELRDAVVRHHSLDRLVRRLVTLFDELHLPAERLPGSTRSGTAR